jgi:hypothetical protein
MDRELRRIGLSLGADICWPVCFEEICRNLDLQIEEDGRQIAFEFERVHIEPFDLQQPCPYDLVIDRLTHWYNTSREWIKKSILLDDLYVFNNPWAVQSMEKATTYSAMMRLGFPVPKTWLLPPKEYEPANDLEPTLHRYAKLFDLGEIGRSIGYPMFMKPYDGGAWVGVSRIENEKDLREAYDKSGKQIMHLQKAVEGFDRFVRCVGIGAQVKYISYDPSAPLHARYQVKRDFLTEEEKLLLRRTTLVINAFFGWDFNSCECLRLDGVFYPIDFANPCPDSQVTSLHYHFPWLIQSKLKWALFCAATRRPMHRTLNWEPFFEIAATDLPFPKKLEAYAELAESHFDTARFESFCERHLQRLPEVTRLVFSGSIARAAVREKVASMFPEHEVDEFTERFWASIQQWIADDREGRSA